MEAVLSILAIVISVLSSWFTIFHRGTVKMTQPHFFALLPEDSPFGGWLKFFVRTLVFSIGQRGRVIESMYVIFKHNNHSIPFHYWMYGATAELEICSGLFVGHEGVGANHHFVPTGSLSRDDLSPGQYEVEIMASLLGDRKPIRLQHFQFNLGEEEATALKNGKDKAVFFVWDRDSKKYKSRIDQRPSKGRSHSVSGSGHGPFAWE